MAEKKVNTRLIYFCVFLIVVLPIIVGVLVWQLMKSDCDERISDMLPVSSASSSGKQTTRSPQTTTLPPSPDAPWRNLRLSRDVMPIHYDITLYPDFYDDHGWFYGNETVEIEVMKDTRFILIHIHYMNVTRTSLRIKENGETISFKAPWYYEGNQYWVIECEQILSAGSVLLLDLTFDGSLTRAIVGFYKSGYINSITKEQRYLVTSKFEPVDARRAFPCFDEPNIKANYTVHLVHKPEYIALSNMPEESVVPWTGDPSLHVTHFKRSVKMSTYLVIFTVCDFKYLNATTKFGTEVRTFATPDRVNQTAFSLKVAVDAMELYEEYFNVPYPLPKQDMIAIPDFVSGAMEHWGLISYRETNMLYDPEEASPANKQRVAVVVAHEVSHQWFGNIVTMDWWDDLWLNEGFASFIEYLGANYSEPSWDMLQQFVTEDVQPIMVTDAGVSSHPIIVHVDNPNQINEVFDSITYSKGASIIRMLESIMGRTKFFKGVGNYLRKYKWANARTDDLWAELNDTNEGAFNVKDVMDTWTLQMGLPYINVSFPSKSTGQTDLVVTQKRFLADKNTNFDENDSKFKYKWYIYIDYITYSSNNGEFWLNQSQSQVSHRIPFDLRVNTSWIKFNKGQTGFYRVNYPQELWKRFSDLLQTANGEQMMSNVDKSGLLDDAFNLARGGYIPYDIPLDLTLYLNKEEAHLPWESTYTAMEYISSRLQTGASFGTWREYVLSKCKPVLEKLGWEDSQDHLQNLMRTNLVALACGMGDKDCLNNASILFRDWLDNDKKVSPNIRSLVYRYGMEKGGSADDWDKMWIKYKTETVPQEQIKLLYGLAHTRQIWLLSRYLEYTKNESMVRSQDFFTVVQYIARNTAGNSLAWDWVRSNYDYLVDRFTTYSRSFGRLVPRIISNFNTDFQLKQVESFFEKYPDAGAGANAREQALETIKGNIEWKKKNEKQITDWLCKTASFC